MSGWCNVSKCLRYHHDHDQHRSGVHALYHNHLGPGAHSFVNTKLIHCPISVTVDRGKSPFLRFLTLTLGVSDFEFGLRPISKRVTIPRKHLLHLRLEVLPRET